jgi:hypothetical protein
VYVVAAAVAESAWDQGVPPWDCFIADAGEGVVLAHEPDDWFARAPLGGHRGGHAGYAEAYVEPVSIQSVDDEPAALLLKQAVLREAPSTSKQIFSTWGTSFSYEGIRVCT